MKPLSIVVPAYRAGNTLVPCLESLRRDMPAGAELILVDDHSPDDTFAIAQRYCDQVIRMQDNRGDGCARTLGIERASGEIILFVDSDVVVPPGTCAKILEAFSRDRDMAGATGRLSCDARHSFFTDYKNLYMNFIFGRLPDQITFLYGSIFAVRASDARQVGVLPVRGGADTAFGQKMALQGKKLRILRHVEVEHLKKYTLMSFYRNDFKIPYSWAILFRVFHGWRQLGRRGTGFAHSSRGQLTSLFAAWGAIVLASLAALGYCSRMWPLAATFLWFCLNARFLAFLTSKRGIWFGFVSIPVTFVDHLVMATGVGVGLINAYFRGTK